jgi:D-serine deaminase-like pyridoxal phosphate-dependent protein
VILDAGSKALAAERMTPLTPHLGHVPSHPGLVVERLYEEHAILTSAEPVEIPVGARLAVVPNHACAAANLHERLVVTAGGEPVGEWAVAARGWESVAHAD